MLSESQVGIEKRLGDSSLLYTCGDIKTNLTDFQVFEVTPQNVVLKRDFPIYDPSYTPIPTQAKKPVTEEGANLEAMKDLFKDEEIIKEIQALYEHTGSLSQILLPPLDSKEKRTEIHKFFKDNFGGKLVTDTVDTNQIRISRRGQGAIKVDGLVGKKRRYDPRNDRTEDTFPYVEFILKKEGMDTIEAVHSLAKFLHISAKDISFAGTKDRKALTVQRMAIRNISIRKLAAVNVNRLKVGLIKPTKSQINLGELNGNHFCLVIRNVEPGLDKARMDQLISGFKENGFMNYYGMQRFGTQSISTQSIGIKLLKREFLEATDLLLSPNPNDSSQLASAKQLWHTEHSVEAAKQILDYLPRQQNTERQLCSSLSRDCKDFQGAWIAIKREMRMLYIHAVQSYIWNRLVSTVMDSPDLPGNLPLLGKDTDLSPVIKPRVLEILGEIGLTLESFKSPGNKALWDLSGDERNIIVKPTNVDYRIIDGVTLELEFSLPKSSYATVALRQFFNALN
jgi:tRNA pseudouridine13 synthase